MNPRNALEIQVIRVLSVLRCVVLGYWAFSEHSFFFGVCAVLGLAGLIPADFSTATRWRLACGYHLLMAGVLLWIALGEGQREGMLRPGSAAWWIWLVATATYVAEALAVISGRVRRIWSFARRPD